MRVSLRASGVLSLLILVALALSLSCGRQGRPDGEPGGLTGRALSPPLMLDRYQGPTVFDLYLGGKRGAEQPSFDDTMPTRGAIRLLVLKVGYLTDFDGLSYTNDQINRRLFSTDPEDGEESLREYYRRASYYDPATFDPTPRRLDDPTIGSLDLSGSIYPAEDGAIYQLDHTYGGGDPFTGITDDDVRGWLDQADQEVDFAQFDSDQNGDVDGIIFILPTEIEDFVPFTRQLMDLGTTYDGKVVRRAIFIHQSQLDNGLHFFEHEVGHLMGLPDYYDYGPLSRFADLGGNPGDDGDESFGVGYWDIMGFGPFTDPAIMPSALDRILLRWDEATLQDFDDFNVFLLDADQAEGRGRVIRIDVPGTEGKEYFLLESRRNDFVYLGDQPSTGTDPVPGLLIWQVDERMVELLLSPDRPPNMYNVNDFEDPHPDLHPFLRLIQADGQFDLMGFEGTGNLGDGGDPAPGTAGVTELNRNTNPPLISYDGSYAINISQIQRLATNNGVSFSLDIGKPLPRGQIVSPPNLSFYNTQGVNDFRIRVEVRGPGDTSEVRLFFERQGETATEPYGVADGVPAIFALQLGGLRNGRYRIRARVDSPQFGSSEDVVLIDVMSLRGDLNEDGVVDEKDVETLNDLLPLGVDNTSGLFRPWIDPSGDGVVDERDLPWIVRFMP